MGGQATEVYTPERPNGSVIIYCHGQGETQTAPAATLKMPTVALLLQHGYTILASAGAGIATWGNPATVDAYAALHDYAVATFSPDTVLWWGDSMGGMGSLNTIFNAAVRNDGWYGIEPGINMRSIYGGGNALINTAFDIPGGGTFDDQTAGYRPEDRAGIEYSFPMRFVASAGDTTIIKANNTDIIRAIAAPFAPESGVITVTGNHGDPSHYLPQDVLDFMRRCRVLAGV